MISGPSGSTALKIVMVLSWKSLHVLRNTVHCASHRRRLKLCDTRKKTYVNICVPELPRSALGQSASKMDWIKVQTKQNLYLFYFWKTWKMWPSKGTNSARFKRLHFWWYGAVLVWNWQYWHIWKRLHQYWKVYTGFTATYALTIYFF